MARISGIDLPKDKRVEIGLTYIYGIGRKTAEIILKETGINPDTRCKDLTEDDFAKIREYIDSLVYQKEFPELNDEQLSIHLKEFNKELIESQTQFLNFIN